MPDSGDIALKLNWYEIQGTNLIGEEPINDLTVEDILKIFDAPFWNKLYHCWSVNEAQIAALTPHVKHPIEPNKYSYFVEMYKQKKTAS